MPTAAPNTGITVPNQAMTKVFIATGILGLVTNIFVITVVAKSRHMRQQPRNWFIIHQGIADLLSAVFIIATVTKAKTVIVAEVRFKVL